MNSSNERIGTGTYDMILANTGFILAEEVDAQGKPTGKPMFKQQRVKYAPGSPSPVSQTYTVEPELEIPAVYAIWRNGIGWREQPPEISQDSNGVWFCRYTDKEGYLLGPSAAVTAFTPGTTDTVVGGNGGTEIPILLPPPSAPSVNNAGTGGTVAAGTYGTKITYVGVTGETAASGNTNTTTSGTTSTITVTSPPAVLSTNGVVGYYVYMTAAGGGTWFLQNPVGQPVAIGKAFILSAPPVTVVQPPANGTYYAQTIVAMMGRYLLYRASDTSWPVLWDSGAGNRITNVVSFRGQQSHPFVYIAYKTAATNVAQIAEVFDCASFSTAFAPEGNSYKATDYLVYREELWVLGLNSFNQWEVRKILDGGVTPTLGGAFVVADGTVQCKNLVTNQDRICIRSTKGLLGVNSSENDAQEITGSTFHAQYQTLNECRPVAFGQFILNSTAGSWHAYDAASGSTAEVGIATRKDNDNQAVTGVHTCAAAYKLWTVYTWTFNRSHLSSLPAPAQPTLSTLTTGGSIGAGTYMVVTTYVDAVGETYASTSQSITTTGANSTLTISTPAANTSAAGWYAYVTDAGGTMYFLQQNYGTPASLGSNLTLTNLKTWGAGPPKAYLWRWGEHELVQTLYSPIPYAETLPCLYGSLYEQFAQVNGCWISDIGGNTPRLYWTDTAGLVSFMQVSQNSANPFTDPAVLYNTTNPAEIYMPASTARNPVELKSNAAIVLSGVNFTSTNFWTATYRLDPSQGYPASNANNLENSGQFTAPIAQRNNWTVASTASWLDVKLTCTNTSANNPPAISSVAIYQILRPVFKWIYTAVVRIGPSVQTHNQGKLPYNVPDARTFLESLGGTQGIVSLQGPDGTSTQVVVTNIAWDPQRREPKSHMFEWYATIEMTEHKPLVIQGMYLRLEPFAYSVLEQYSYAQLASY